MVQAGPWLVKEYDILQFSVFFVAPVNGSLQLKAAWLEIVAQSASGPRLMTAKVQASFRTDIVALEDATKQHGYVGNLTAIFATAAA